MIAGFAYMQWREWQNPGTLSRGARMMLHRGSAGEVKPESLTSLAAHGEALETD